MGVASHIGNVARCIFFIIVAVGSVTVNLVVIACRLRAVFFGLLFQQFLAITYRNLIIIGVNFVKGEEAVSIAAIFHKGRLQRRLNAGDFGKINVTAKRRFGLRLEVEFLNLIVVGHHHPRFFRVDGID